MLNNDREKYEQFWAAFGMQFKYALMNAYGNNRDTLRDLMLFWSSKEDKLTSLQEYVDRMPGPRRRSTTSAPTPWSTPPRCPRPSGC